MWFVLSKALLPAACVRENESWAVPAAHGGVQGIHMTWGIIGIGGNVAE